MTNQSMMRSARSAAALAGLLLIGREAAADSAPTLTPQQYFTAVANVLFTEGARPSYTSVKAQLLGVGTHYQQQYNALKILAAPSDILPTHQVLLEALASNAAAEYTAALATPTSASNADIQTFNRYAYATALTGYATSDQANAVCNLEKIAASYKIAFAATASSCITQGQTAPSKSVGTADNPVNYVEIVHKPVAKDKNGLGRPNVEAWEISSITASAKQPVTIVFDNENTMPFIFNLAIYKGKPDRALPFELIAETVPYSGPNIQSVSVSLPAGDYVYIDNVHPGALRGTLTVVP